MKIQLFELSTNQEILEFEAVIKDGEIIAVKPNHQNYFVGKDKLTTEEGVENATNKEMKTYFFADDYKRVYKMIVWLNF